MSMNFDRPISEEHQDFIKKLMGDQVEALDDRTTLLNTAFIDQKKMSAIANKTNQVVTVEINEPDEIKTMSDGTRYKVTPHGWVKVEAE